MVPEISWSLYQNCVRNNKGTIFRQNLATFPLRKDPYQNLDYFNKLLQVTVELESVNTCKEKFIYRKPVDSYICTKPADKDSCKVNAI